MKLKELNDMLRKSKPEPIMPKGEPIDNIMYDTAMVRLEKKGIAQSTKKIVGKVCAELVSDTDFKRAIARTLKKLFPEQLKGIEIHTSDERLEQQVSEKILNMRTLLDEMKDNPIFKKRRELSE